MSETEAPPNELSLSSSFTTELPELPKWTIEDLYLHELGETESTIIRPPMPCTEDKDSNVVQNSLIDTKTSGSTTSSQIIPEVRFGSAGVGTSVYHNVDHQSQDAGVYVKERNPKATNNVHVLGYASTYVPTLNRQITKTFGRPPLPHPDACRACLDVPDQSIYLTCGHSFCKQCLNTLVRVGIANKASFPPRCCTGKYGAGIHFQSIQQHLESDILVRYQNVIEEFSTINPIYCANKTCGSFMQRKQIQDFKGKFITCITCALETCKDCRQDRKAHIGQDSNDCPKLEEMMNAGDQALAKSKRWKQCPGCRNLVERIGGCNRMLCECRTEFCYQCGQHFTDSAPQCPCMNTRRRRNLNTNRNRSTAMSKLAKEPTTSESRTVVKETNSTTQTLMTFKRKVPASAEQAAAFDQKPQVEQIASTQNERVSKRQKLMKTEDTEDTQLKSSAETPNQNLMEELSGAQISSLISNPTFPSMPEQPLPMDTQCLNGYWPNIGRSGFQTGVASQDGIPSYATQSFPPLSTHQNRVLVEDPRLYGTWGNLQGGPFNTARQVFMRSVPYQPPLVLRSDYDAFSKTSRGTITQANLTSYPGGNCQRTFDPNMIHFQGYQRAYGSPQTSDCVKIPHTNLTESQKNPLRSQTEQIYFFPSVGGHCLGGVNNGDCDMRKWI